MAEHLPRVKIQKNPIYFPIFIAVMHTVQITQNNEYIKVTYSHKQYINMKNM